MRVVIEERSPAALSTVGVSITGARSPTRGTRSNLPTMTLGSSVPVISSPSLTSAAIRHSPSLGKSTSVA
jgi:hypothetical protein